MLRLLAAPAAALAFLAATFVPAHAFDTPEALIEAFYGPFLVDEVPDDELSFFSKDTRTAWELLMEQDDYGLGFDPVVDGQDFNIAGFAVSEPEPAGKGVEVTVEFENFGEPRVMIYTLIEEDEGWLVHDIEAVHGEGWRLRELLGE
ncbi:hypothetical protein [Devosia nitrariae]|uniref:DUF3828 domain-containing protein n=1 Tax=Devosia nitrariae TaxID=2071872 RepID=A0ABQ5W078_9HYPH|nr:hypothetical protein [Devosia nitrariae]GLQ53469.1 hypothetical protein GCM10010862_07280 [Devosia nitrariae]